jgi:hypothetical protein
MSTLSRRRGVVPACVTLLCAFGLLLAAGSARAAPGTDGGLTVSDTTPAPGETITVSWDVTYTDPAFAPQLNRPHTVLGLGTNGGGGPYDDLSLVAGSCTGDMTACAVNPFTLGVASEVPQVTAFGQRRAGSVQLVVSAGATIGETINMSGFASAFNNNGSGASLIIGSVPITVTAPPAADLGVSLSARAGPPLHGKVNYDATVTDNGPAAASSATLTTQLPWQATGISAAGSCTYAGTTHQVTCPVGALANGATTHVTFTAQYGLLSFGALTATATLSAVTPTDPNPANDSSSATCHALTGPLISC